VNPELSVLMQKAIELTEELPEQEIASLSYDLKNEIISIKSLQIVYRINKSNLRQPLLKLLNGCNMVFPDHRQKPMKENPELAKRREYLKMKQEEREYNKMVHGTESNPNVVDALTLGNEFASFKNQAAIGMNMIMAVLATFGIAYYIGSKLKYEKSTCLGLGLAAAISIMIIEMFLFIFRSMQMEHEFERPASQSKEATVKLRVGALNPVDATFCYRDENESRTAAKSDQMKKID
jgi:hypothetical protein